ncbi:MAG: protein-L-isoaspartate(D-aspartate) O-methyltransferase [Candidatus Micrarchaeia archaeon]
MRTIFTILFLLFLLLFLSFIFINLQRKPEDKNAPSIIPPAESAFQETEEQKSARVRMVNEQIIGRGVRDSRVISAMRTVLRHEFVPDNLRGEAYNDYPLPIGEGQTISQPYIVALMTEKLQLNGSERVLEIGTGSGYQAAILSEIVGAENVFTIEIIGPLARRANATLNRLGYGKVHVKNADGYFGWEEYAPFDAVMITAAVDHIPPPLIAQLADGGRLILPLGSTRYYQTLTLVKKEGGEIRTEYITDVRFVPMTGEALRRSGG